MDVKRSRPRSERRADCYQAGHDQNLFEVCSLELQAEFYYTSIDASSPKPIVDPPSASGPDASVHSIMTRHASMTKVLIAGLGSIGRRHLP